MSNAHEPRASANPGYERADAHMLPLVVFGVLLTILVFVVCVGIKRMQSTWERETLEGRGTPHPMAGQREAPLEPLLQADPGEEIGSQRDIVEGRLNGYGWVDREQGIVHIPIESAMRKLLERGVPTREDHQSGEGAR